MTHPLADALADLSARVARGCSDIELIELIDLIAQLEHLQRAAVAVQAEAIAAFSTQVRARDAEHGVARERRGASVAPQVALARGASPRKGDRFVGTATPWSTRCPAPSPPCGLGGSMSGPSPASSAKPPA